MSGGGGGGGGGVRWVGGRMKGSQTSRRCCVSPRPLDSGGSVVTSCGGTDQGEASCLFAPRPPPTPCETRPRCQSAEAPPPTAQVLRRNLTRVFNRRSIAASCRYFHRGKKPPPVFAPCFELMSCCTFPGWEGSLTWGRCQRVPLVMSQRGDFQ